MPLCAFEVGFFEEGLRSSISKYVMCSSFQKLKNKAAVAFSLTGPCQLVNERGTVIDSNEILMFLQSTSKISFYVQEKNVSNRVNRMTCGSPVTSDDVEIGRSVLVQESDTPRETPDNDTCVISEEIIAIISSGLDWRIF
jgi:hypothetical protein